MKKIINKRPLKPKYWILCEGETEECYFSIVKELKLLWVQIQIKKIGQLPWNNKKRIIWEKKKIGYSDKELKETASKVFFILDADVYSQQQIDEQRRILETDNIHLLYSNKNFELRILLHLEKYAKEGDNYIREIKKHKRNYEKWNSSSTRTILKDLIQNNLKDAISNSENLEKINKGISNLSEKNPYTLVYKLFSDHSKSTPASSQSSSQTQSNTSS